MNFGAILDFGNNGRLRRDFSEFTALSTMTICLTIVSVLVIATFAYYFIQFKRREGATKYFNQRLIWSTIGLVSTSVLFWVLNFVFYHKAQAVFKTPELAQNVMISLLVIGFLLVFMSMGLVWLKLPYFGVVISNDSFWFLGESLDFTKVVKIITDDTSKALFINYAASVRMFKYYRLKLNSGTAKFLIANLPEAFEIEPGSQSDYFKELVKTLPSQDQN